MFAYSPLLADMYDMSIVDSISFFDDLRYIYIWLTQLWLSPLTGGI